MRAALVAEQTLNNSEMYNDNTIGVLTATTTIGGNQPHESGPSRGVRGACFARTRFLPTLIIIYNQTASNPLYATRI